jgi:hypothetical protein
MDPILLSARSTGLIREAQAKTAHRGRVTPQETEGPGKRGGRQRATAQATTALGWTGRRHRGRPEATKRPALRCPGIQRVCMSVFRRRSGRLRGARPESEPDREGKCGLLGGQVDAWEADTLPTELLPLGSRSLRASAFRRAHRRPSGAHPTTSPTGAATSALTAEVASFRRHLAARNLSPKTERTMGGSEPGFLRM